MVAHAFAAVLEAEGQVSEEQGFLKFLLLVLPKAACACVQDPVKAERLPATSLPQLFTCLPTSHQLRLCCLHCFGLPTLSCREFSRESCCTSNFPFPAELGPGKTLAKSNKFSKIKLLADTFHLQRPHAPDHSGWAKETCASFWYREQD